MFANLNIKKKINIFLQTKTIQREIPDNKRIKTLHSKKYIKILKINNLRIEYSMLYFMP